MTAAAAEAVPVIPGASAASIEDNDFDGAAGPALAPTPVADDDAASVEDIDNDDNNDEFNRSSRYFL